MARSADRRRSRKAGGEEAHRDKEPVKHTDGDCDANYEVLTAGILPATRACCVRGKLLCLSTINISLPTAGPREPDHREHLRAGVIRQAARKVASGASLRIKRSPPKRATGYGSLTRFSRRPETAVPKRQRAVSAQAGYLRACFHALARAPSRRGHGSSADYR